MKATITKVNGVKNTITMKADAQAKGRFLKEALYWARVADVAGFNVGDVLTLTDEEQEALNEID